MNNRTRIITFYLPQYHPIPENDLWWGKGFTDWINVAKSRPRYRGHYQPQIPSELGFYDLRNEEIRVKQAQMAEDHGISGFCYYHYWFNGKMLLEKPFDEVLSSNKPDFPFCLCWANENWTRRWDGKDSEILMEQKYSEYDVIEHLEWLSKAFSDTRYININGKPLFLLYNASGIPNLKYFISQLKANILKFNIPDLYLCSVKSIHNKLSDSEAIEAGFDAIVEFIPSSDNLIPKKVSGLPRYYLSRIYNIIIDILKLNKIIDKKPLTMIYDYKKYVEKYISNNKYEYKTFPCVIPSWDNSARKKISASIQNNDPELFKKWLRNSINKVQDYEEEERIIFINAWNEWAEGCHLEPDIRNGKMFLEAVNQVTKENKQ